MAFLSGLTPDDYNKKPGDLIKSSDWGMLVSDVIGLGKAKLDRDGDTLHGTLSVAGALTIDGTGHVGNLRITPGSASSGLWLGDVGESNWGVYRRVAGTLQSPRRYCSRWQPVQWPGAVHSDGSRCGQHPDCGKPGRATQLKRARQ